MTAKDLRKFPGVIDMCNSDAFRVLLAYFMEECPFVGQAGTDATSLIRNEGMLQGHMRLLREMRTIHIAPPEVEKPEFPHRKYVDPSETTFENPNRPTK